MSTGPTIHLLSQYLWPDDAPTGIYVEQLADALVELGAEVRMVGGKGRYREGQRKPPRAPIHRIAHYEGKRGNLVQTAIEYEAVRRAFAQYIDEHVHARDVVVITSAPPTTLFLYRALRARGAVGVYWLQDYYPQLIRGVLDAPAPVRALLAAFWERELAAWPCVVKAAANLGYYGANTTVIRNWQTLDLGEPAAFVPRTALYSGNLGYGHDMSRFIALCEQLRAEGFAITVRGDGPGMVRLPSWINAEKPFTHPADLLRSYWAAEVHLIAGHEELSDAVFPSKFWNAHATGRRVLGSGFAGSMAAELEAARATDPRNHARSQIEAWTRLLLSLRDGQTFGGGR